MARFMFFNGLCYTRELGKLENLQNPYIQENLAIAFQMQLFADEYYPGLTRRIYLKGYRYNMHFRPKSLLIELGSQTNTVAEAKNSCEPLAHIISSVLKGENK
jgi:stage II sporulation protein P